VEKSEWIWMNGELVPWDDAKVHVLSHGLHYGTGVFEGIRAYETQHGTAVFRHREHLERLEKSAELYYLDLPYSVDELRDATHELIRRNGLRACYIRPIAFRGYGEMGLYAQGSPVEVAIGVWKWGAYLGDEGKRHGVRAKLSSWRRISSDSLVTQAKASGHYLNSILAKIETTREGYEEAIMLDHTGMVSEASGENIFIVRDGVLATPPPGTILDGVTRQSIMKIARDLGYEVVERAIAPSELTLAQEVFLTGTAAELVPVREVDGHVLGDPGEVTLQLQQRYEDALYGRTERYREWLDIVEQPSKVTS
jgi:branched-chain amino acid aminotransferase